MIRDLTDLVIDRIIVHRQVAKLGGKDTPDPKKSTKLLTLDAEGAGVLKLRLEAVLKCNSKSVQLLTDPNAADSAFHTSVACLGCSDADFIEHSYNLAVDLKKAHEKKTVPNGIVAVLTGQVGTKQERYVLILRASAKPGFAFPEEEFDGSSLTYIKNVVLGPDAKLYKIGMYIESTRSAKTERHHNEFDIIVFDDLVTQGREDKASKYFYKDFLGCKIDPDSTTWSNAFYDESLNFIRKSGTTPEKQLAAERHLVTYVLSSQYGDLNATDFAGIAFDSAESDAYYKHLRGTSVHDRSIVKDAASLESLQARTLNHSISFNSKVSIKIPRSIFMDKRFSIQPLENGMTALNIPGTVDITSHDA